MKMGVEEPGHDRPASEVAALSAGSDRSKRLVVRPDGHNAVAYRGERLGGGLRSILGIDPPVEQGQPLDGGHGNVAALHRDCGSLLECNAFHCFAYETTGRHSPL